MSLVSQSITVVVEVPRWSFVKRGASGEREFVSPVPCPFNYGSVRGVAGHDGDLQDAVVLGPRLRAGTQVQTSVWMVVQFQDEGAVDNKWICSTAPPTRMEEIGVVVFFRIYARCKWAMNFLCGRRGTTSYLGVTKPRFDPPMG